MVHAISKALGIEGHAGFGTKNGKWSISLPIDEESLQRSIPVFIYELDNRDFTHEPVLGEWVTDKTIIPRKIIESTVGEALTHFQDVKFLIEGRPNNPEEGWI